MAQKNPPVTTTSQESLIDSPKSASKKWLPHVIVISLFLAITAIYFAPAVFENKVLFQEDIMRAKGVSKELADYREKTGEEALWTNSLFGGMPAYQISVYYVASKLEIVNKIFSLFLPHPARYIFICLLGFYILMLVLKVDPWLALAGSLAYGFSAYFFVLLEAGHNTKVAAIAYMAPVMAGIIMTYRGKMWSGLALAALALSMEIYCNHPQITYYLGFLIVFYALGEAFMAIKEKRLPDFIKRSALLGGAAAIALGINITGLWATAEYSEVTIRGGHDLTIQPDGTPNASNTTSGLDKDYATAWSYGVSETFTLLIPNFKGGASAPIGNNETALKNIDPQKREAVANMNQYFGEQPFTSGPVYAGAIVVFLFLLGLLIPAAPERRPLKWAILAATILSIWLAWGRHDPFGLSDFMLDHFPMYNKFRAVYTIMMVAELCLPLLGFLALDSLVRHKNFLSEKFALPFKIQLTGQNILIYSFAIAGGFALISWVMPGLFNDFAPASERSELFMRYKQSGQDVTDQQINAYLDQVMPAVATAREAIVSADSMRSFMFILAAAVLIWLFLKTKVNRALLSGGLALLVLMDMAVVAKRYLSAENFKPKQEMQNPLAAMGRPHAADQQIMQDKDPNYRVWNTLARPDQDAATSYFHKSIGGYHGAKLRRYQDLIDFHINRRNLKVINMLNAKYIIVPGQDNQPMVYPNPEALGNAWFVRDIKWVATPDSEITALNNFDPANQMVVNEKFKSELDGFKPAADSTATIRLTEYQPNRLKYESSSTQEGLVVFSEIYYPAGWNAYVDDKPVAHFQANYVLRAMRIPAGKHTIEYRFEPKVISTGETISMASMALLVLLCGGALFMTWKEKQATTN